MFQGRLYRITLNIKQIVSANRQQKRKRVNTFQKLVIEQTFSTWCWHTQLKRRFGLHELPRPAENTKTGISMSYVSLNMSLVPSRNDRSYFSANSSKSCGFNAKPLHVLNEKNVYTDIEFLPQNPNKIDVTHLSSSVLSRHHSIMCVRFTSSDIFGQISIGRYFLYSFVDSTENVDGTDLHLANMPKLDITGMPSSRFCLVNVKSKSVTICNCCRPPAIILFSICSRRWRSLILQLVRDSSSIWSRRMKLLSISIGRTK